MDGDLLLMTGPLDLMYAFNFLVDIDTDGDQIGLIKVSWQELEKRLSC